MSAVIKQIGLSEPVFYHREYAHDIGEPSNEHSWLHECKRVGIVALPFFSLCKPLSFPISLAMGGLRTVNSISCLAEAIQKGDSTEISYELLQTIISVISLASTVFAHPLGMFITTGHDVLIELYHLAQNVYCGEYQKAIENCLSIVNNALYLLLFLDGGLEFAIASLAMQILVGLYHSLSEFRKGNYLEGTGHIAMAIIRSTQLAGQVKVLQMKWEIEMAIQKKHPDDNSSKISSNDISPQKKEAHTVPFSQMLNEAQKTNDQELIDILIKYGNNPDGIPVLLYAIKLGDEKAVNLLLAHGASAFTKDHKNRNCLYFAVDSGNINLVKKFVVLGVSPNDAYDGWETAFFYAIKTKKNEMAQYFYDNGGEIYAQPSNFSAWEACFHYDNYCMCKFLLNKSAEIRYYEPDFEKNIFFGFNDELFQKWLISHEKTGWDVG